MPKFANSAPWVLATVSIITGLLWTSAQSKAAEIAVTSPNGGEVWQAGSAQTITWSSSILTGTVYLDLYRDNGGVYEEAALLGWVPTSDGSFNFTVPPYVGDGNNYVVRLYWTDGSSTAIDYSDSVFEIHGSRSVPVVTISSPQKGTIWPAGTTQTITWTSTENTGNMDMSLFRMAADGSYEWVDYLAGAALSDGTLDCIVPSYVGDGRNYVIVADWWDAGASATYYGEEFEITGTLPLPTINITSPSGGEHWPAGSLQTITWTSTHPADDVTISLCRLLADGEYLWVASLGSATMAAGPCDRLNAACLPHFSPIRVC